MIKRPPMISSGRNLSIEMIENIETLNLYSDASMANGFNTKNLRSCYGSVAECCGNIIAEDYRLESCTSVPAAELRGIRTSLSIALLNRYNYRVINIFSDSQIAICSLRDYIYTWEYSPKKDAFMTVCHGKAKNQSLIIECFALLQNLRQTNIVNLFHQKGHVDSKWKDILNARDVFRHINDVYGDVSVEFITHISSYNNYVDNRTRDILHESNNHIIYSDAIDYLPMGGLLYERR